MACANEQEYERRPQERSPLCRRCSAGSETFCPQVDEAPHVLAGPRHAAPPATCEPLVGSAVVVVAQCRGIFERAYLQYVCSDSCAESSSEAVTDASCKLRHKGTRDHARERPHRRPCHPLIIHLAPIDSMLCCGPASKRSAAQNRTKRPPATINPLPLPLQRSAVSRVARPNHGQHAIVSPWHHVQ